MTTLIIIAKECIPGRVKTRLHPPLSLEQAATLASASLADTFRAVETLDASRRILLFDGNLLPLGSEPYDVIHQVSGDLDMRLGAIFDECEGPTVLVGMDTPQLDPAMLSPLFGEWPSGVDAFLGFANDGGYWTIAMAEPDGSLIRGVPMSRDDTGRLQLERLTEAGLSVLMLPELVDVDTIEDARVVAGLAPHTEFARTLASFDTRADEQGTNR
ncbi:TIGR04282 family arsenosugar biosynthesis glycosyltransferase [Lacisediminihabitans sp. FW035]